MILAILHTTLMWGSAAALAAAASVCLGERYLHHGLEALAVEALADALLRYLPAALAGAAIGQAVATTTGSERAARAIVPAALCVAALLDARLGSMLPRSWILAGIATAGLSFTLLGPRLASVPGWRQLRVASAGALALLVAGAFVADRFLLRRASSADHPNVLLVVLDTVRADRLSAYGYERPTTPRLEQLAHESVRFTDFHSTSSWTLPSHASLFTGLYPALHGATQEYQWLRHRFATLAEVFRNAGYETVAVVGNPWAGILPQLDQGFGRVAETWRDGKGYEQRDPGAPHEINEEVKRILAGIPRERPFFLFLNYADAHAPHTPAEPHRSRFLRRAVSREHADALARRSWTEHYAGHPSTEEDLSILSDLYDGEIAELDAVIGDLLDALREDGRLDDTWTVVTSDHGEHFGENERITHVFTLYGVAVRIPLFVRPPGGVPGGRLDTRPGQLVDLVPTLLSAAGIPTDALPHQGRDLFDPAADPPAPLAEYYWPMQVFDIFSPEQLRAAAPVVKDFERRLRSIEQDGLRLIWSSDGRNELYDLRADPGETTNLYGRPERREEAARLEALLAARLDHLGVPTDPPPPRQKSSAIPDAETAEALRALGYAR